MKSYASQQRKMITELAARMLAGSLSFIEGAQKINKMRFDAELENDPDILPFVGIDCENDALPLNPEIRKLWNAGALAKLQPEIDRAEEWARQFGTRHRQSLISRFQKEE